MWQCWLPLGGCSNLGDLFLKRKPSIWLTRWHGLPQHVPEKEMSPCGPYHLALVTGLSNFLSREELLKSMARCSGN